MSDEWTAIQGRVLRPIGLTTFADITDVPLAKDGITRNGLLFAGPLTPEQVEAIWWRATSRDDEDESARRLLKGAMDGGATNLDDLNTAYRLGLPLPEPTWPVPEPEPHLVTATASKVANLAAKKSVK